MVGRSVEADGTGGIAVLFQRPHRCLSINGSIQVIGIPQWSGNKPFAGRITVTSHAMP